MGSWQPGTAEILGIILVISVLVIIVWAFFSAYKKRGEEIRSLRKELEELKSEGEGSKG